MLFLEQNFPQSIQKLNSHTENLNLSFLNQNKRIEICYHLTRFEMEFSGDTSRVTSFAGVFRRGTEAIWGILTESKYTPPTDRVSGQFRQLIPWRMWNGPPQTPQTITALSR